MDVEITGMPEPKISWYKEDRPLKQGMISEFKLTQLGNCYKLILDNGLKTERFSNGIFNFFSLISLFKQLRFKIPANTW